MNKKKRKYVLPSKTIPWCKPLIVCLIAAGIFTPIIFYRVNAIRYSTAVRDVEQGLGYVTDQTSLTSTAESADTQNAQNDAGQAVQWIGIFGAGAFFLALAYYLHRSIES